MTGPLLQWKNKLYKLSGKNCGLLWIGTANGWQVATEKTLSYIIIHGVITFCIWKINTLKYLPLSFHMSPEKQGSITSYCSGKWARTHPPRRSGWTRAISFVGFSQSCYPLENFRLARIAKVDNERSTFVAPTISFPKKIIPRTYSENC